MAKKTIGGWERDPIHRGTIFFATYCATCGDKVYLSEYQARQFLENTHIHLGEMTVAKIIKKRLTDKLPRIRISIERGEGTDRDRGVHNSDTLTGGLDSVIINTNRI